MGNQLSHMAQFGSYITNLLGNKIILFFVLLAPVLLLTSCRGTKVLSNNHVANTVKTIETKDSSFTTATVHYRDTTIFITADTAAIMSMVNCDSIGRVNLPKTKIKSGKATVTVQILDNELIATANCDSLETVIAIKDSIIYHTNQQLITTTTTTNSTQTQQVEVRYVPNWIKVFACIGGLATLWAGFKAVSTFKSFTPVGFVTGLISKLFG